MLTFKCRTCGSEWFIYEVKTQNKKLVLKQYAEHQDLPIFCPYCGSEEIDRNTYENMNVVCSAFRIIAGKGLEE